MCDGGQRLLYLLHCCKGKVRKAVKAFVTLPPEAGYKRACWILKDLFGRPHEIARSLPDALFEGI